MVQSLYLGKKKKLIKILEKKNVIERKLNENDFGIFNRQPTLHKASMMGHKIVLTNSKTLNLNLAVTPPYNADFDGDEGNLFIPQNVKSTLEVATMMNVKNNIFVPQYKMPIVKPVQDTVIASFLGASFFINSTPFTNSTHDTIAKYNIWKDSNIYNIIFDNFLKKNGILMFINEPLKAGLLTTWLGKIAINFGNEKYLSLIKVLQQRGNFLLIKKPISIGIDDCYMERIHLNKIYNNILSNEVTKDIIQLNNLRDKVSDKIIKSTKKNSLLQIIKSGSKGSLLNFCQIAISLGLQVVEGTFIEEKIPYIHKDELEKLGYIKSCFTGGLSNLEYIFHSIASREGLVSTATKTGRMGYIQRKLVKLMEDIKVSNDFTMREHSQIIVQFGFINSKYCILNNIGEMTGVIAAQSIGEPSTQLTLNSFHLAGSNKITGLEKIEEIINMKKNDENSLIYIYYYDNRNIFNITKYSSKLVSILLEDIIVSCEILASKRNSNYKEKLDFENLNLKLKLNKNKMNKFQIDLLTIKSVLTKTNPDIKIVYNPLNIESIHIQYPVTKTSNYKSRIEDNIKMLKISGLEKIQKITHQLNKKTKRYYSITTGTDYSKILEFISKEENIKDFTRTYSTNLQEISNVLGIEACRNYIFEELVKLFEENGIYVKRNHLSLLADSMTHKGFVSTATRFHIKKDTSSVLSKISFEDPMSFLVDAASHNLTDNTDTVSKNIISGDLVLDFH